MHSLKNSKTIMIRFLILLSSLTLFPLPLLAAEYHLDGAQISLLWGIPFAGILLSIAIMPLLAPAFWHHHYGKVSLFWGLALAIPFFLTFGLNISLFEASHVLFLEFIPFIILILSLYTCAGGVHIQYNKQASPLTNTLFLLIGTLLASVIGTTGTAMILIRPLISINQHRKNTVHIIIFFIFLVANIGGSLSPIGDPPLFLGFLKGVPFFWPTLNLFPPMLIASAYLLSLFFLVDSFYYKKEKIIPQTNQNQTSQPSFSLQGIPNIFILLAAVAAVIASGIFASFFTLSFFGITIESKNIMRDLFLVLAAILSLAITPKAIRQKNLFSWEPLLEVAKLFACIFITIVPVIAILKAGHDGQLAPLIQATSDANGQPINAVYFWITGILSSFLDNAPTYLVFFNVAGGDPVLLTTTLKQTLLAISVGAVFMGANTYIGNAPNFMVKAIAEDRGIPMPSFFGYMARALIILIPIFLIITFIFF
jgi:Na+/H+ antiporter NhaD/arsenite permease-like protein